MPTYKPQLKELILHRTNMITNDCRTFLAAKTQCTSTLRMAQKGEIGGGNLLCAIGLFSLLNLLSKVFILTKDFDKYLNRDANTGTRTGRVNEEVAFSEFINYLQSSELDLGLPN